MFQVAYMSMKTYIELTQNVYTYKAKIVLSSTNWTNNVGRNTMKQIFIYIFVCVSVCMYVCVNTKIYFVIMCW